MSEEDKKNATPVIRISVTSVVGDKKQMSFETYVDQITPVDVINSLVDRIMAVTDRQVAVAELKDLEKLLIKDTNELEGLKDDFRRVENMHAKAKQERSGQRTPYKLLPKEEQERTNVLTNVEVRTKRLAQLKEDIARRKAIVGTQD